MAAEYLPFDFERNLAAKNYFYKMHHWETNWKNRWNVPCVLYLDPYARAKVLFKSEFAFYENFKKILGLGKFFWLSVNSWWSCLFIFMKFCSMKFSFWLLNEIVFLLIMINKKIICKSFSHIAVFILWNSYLKCCVIIFVYIFQSYLPCFKFYSRRKESSTGDIHCNRFYCL